MRRHVAPPAFVIFVLGISIGCILQTPLHQALIPLAGSTQPAQEQRKENVSPILIPASCGTLNTSAFNQIYKAGHWGAQLGPVEAFYSNAEWPPKQRLSASGPGSNRGDATEISLRVLNEAIVAFNVSSMIDLPCGDVNWIFDSWRTDSLALYLGLDIVQDVIEFDNMRFAHHSNKIFRHWDGATCRLPKYQLEPDKAPRSFEMVHSRDVLQHLPLSLALEFLCNVFQSGAKVFVTTTYPHNSTNTDVIEGGFFQNDLTMEPFGLPHVETCTPTHPNHEPDHTCVFDLTGPWVQTFIAKNKC
jgi:hypothetical protein